MKLIRELERRLEYLLDGLAGRVFRGPLHPSELAANLVRRLDLDIDEDRRAPNHVEIRVSADDLEGAVPPEVPSAIADLLDEAAAERGWRLEGPVEVTLTADQAIGTGRVRMTTATRPGPRPPWGSLHGESVMPLAVNRAVIGRDGSGDVVIPDDRVSRRHAMIWQESGRVFVADLGSANGTMVDGKPINDEATAVEPGSIITIGPVSFRFYPS